MQRNKIRTLMFADVCPILCSSHGTYGGGLCHCDEGWKGTNCDVPAHDCKLSDCSGHGECNKGVCTCNPGWKGDNCDIVKYLHYTVGLLTKKISPGDIRCTLYTIYIHFRMQNRSKMSAKQHFAKRVKAIQNV